MAEATEPKQLLLPRGLPAVLLVGADCALFVYRPDRPVATIVPGSSSGPAFVVQVIRPRAGLPLGGVLPPQPFGQEADLGLGSTSAGASIGSVEPGRLELGADHRDLVLIRDADGRVLPEALVVFELVFEGRVRKVRCRAGDPAIGTLSTNTLAGSGELSGNFEIELPRCEDAATGKSIGWPPKPLVLRGSFDRLPQDTAAKEPRADPPARVPATLSGPCCCLPSSSPCSGSRSPR